MFQDKLVKEISKVEFELSEMKIRLHQRLTSSLWKVIIENHLLDSQHYETIFNKTSNKNCEIRRREFEPNEWDRFFGYYQEAFSAVEDHEYELFFRFNTKDFCAILLPKEMAIEITIYEEEKR